MEVTHALPIVTYIFPLSVRLLVIYMQMNAWVTLISFYNEYHCDFYMFQLYTETLLTDFRLHTHEISETPTAKVTNSLEML